MLYHLAISISPQISPNNSLLILQITCVISCCITGVVHILRNQYFGKFYPPPPPPLNEIKVRKYFFGFSRNIFFRPKIFQVKIFSRSMTRAEGTKESRTRVSERGFFLNMVACACRACVRVCVRVLCLMLRADMSPTFLTYLRKVILRDNLN